ncbi:MAG: ABC transporter six-transmembrane domain-containing protein [Gemmatimonadota bacterium]
MSSEQAVTISGLVRRFWVRVSITTVLVVLESVVTVLFPLFIGLAINGLLVDSMNGVIAFGALVAAAVILGSARRAYDTRAYAAIYETTASELVERERARGTDVSTVVARTRLLSEFVQFLETSLPGVANGSISLVGTLVILATINIPVFLGCLGVVLVVVVQYALTGRLNYRLNEGFNDELEGQVDAIASPDPVVARTHFRTLMRWSIRLSDLETVNYAVIFVAVIALLVYAPVALVDQTAEYGFVFAALMYVFQFTGDLEAFPYYVQQVIRLREISARLGDTGEDAAPA